MLMSDACSAYMEAKSKRLRRTTLEGYASGLRCHVLPMWGARELESIRRREVQEWVDGFDLPGAAEKALKCLRQVMRWAIRSYDLEIFDPTQGVELPAKPVYRRESMDAREEASVLRAAVLIRTMIGSSPPDVTFWEGVADSMCAENFTCRDTEGYVRAFQFFHAELEYLLL